MISKDVLTAIATLPISEDNPFGRDVRLEEDYQALQLEIEKLSSMTASSTVNWQVVVERALAVLKVSKDLTAAAYLSVGLIETQSIESLSLGAELLAGLLDNFWEGLTPGLNRLRARKNALTWWTDKAALALKKVNSPLKAQAKDYLVQNLTHLNKALGQRDLSPIREIISLAQNLESQAPDKPPAKSSPAPEKAAVATTAPASSSSSAASAPLAPPSDPAEAKNNLLNAADDYLSLLGVPKIDDPWYWKISRLKRWLNITNPPPADGLTTMIPGPPEEALKNISDLRTNGHLEACLAASEDLANAYLFWLDLQYESYQCLSSLGYLLSAAALKDEVGQLVGRFPSLLLLTFNDFRPLASEATRLWLKKDDGKTQASSPLDHFRSLIQGDPLTDLNLLSEPANRPSDGRSLFAKRLVEASLWQNLGRFSVASGLADWIISEIDRIDLGAWDPYLTIEAL
ncbi:MAG: type VI secretion system protein TssA, partial [Deltaproteobacteria bacterium]|nr:type VI secretion system protein TssA [Deltaproteobacteria bacterium]